jgi:hypothetical protein
MGGTYPVVGDRDGAGIALGASRRLRLRRRRINGRLARLHRAATVFHHPRPEPTMPSQDPQLPSMIRFLAWSSDESRSVLAKVLEDLYGPNVICRCN